MSDYYQPRLKRIAVVNYPRSLLTSVAFPVDILNAAAKVYTAKYKQTYQLLCDIIPLDVSIGVDTPSPFLSAINQVSLNYDVEYDLVILPAIWRNPMPLVQQAGELLRWLNVQHQKNTFICAVGTASCFFAEAGLLDNKPATTHWSYFDQFVKRYPEVKLKRHHLLTRADNIFCAGSINSLADLCIYFSELFFDKDIAKQVESHFSPEIRRPIEPQIYVEDVLNHNVADERVVDVQYYVRENYMYPLSVKAIASHFKMSTRNLSRCFKQETSKTVTKYIQSYRLSIAISLLRDSDLSVAEIGAQTGFSDSSYFIRMFKREMHVTPQTYRQRMRSKLFK